jgi:hypothetical protein
MPTSSEGGVIHVYEDGVVAIEFQHACIVRDKRRSMSNEEFWEDVFGTGVWEPVEPDWDCVGIDSPNPCPECGSTGACGYDSEGRPMIHTVQEDDNG